MSTIEEIDLLALVYDILKCIERESNDTSGKRTEESSQKILEFQKKLDLLREQVQNLPGINVSKETQLRHYNLLQEQLQLKKQLLQKYKDVCTTEGGNLKQYLGT